MTLRAHSVTLLLEHELGHAPITFYQLYLAPDVALGDRHLLQTALDSQVRAVRHLAASSSSVATVLGALLF